MAKNKVRKGKGSKKNVMERLSDRNVVVFVAILISAGLIISSSIFAVGSYFSSTPASSGSISAMESQLKDNPDDVNLIYNLANAYYSDGGSKLGSKPEEAKKSLQKAISLYTKVVAKQPKNKAAFGDMATSYFYNGDTNKAIETVQKALKIDPQFGPAILNYATYVGSTGDYVKAIQILKGMNKTNADYQSAQSMIQQFEGQLSQK